MITVPLDQTARFADEERETSGHLTAVQLIQNGDFVDIIAVRPDGSISWSILSVLRSDLDRLGDAIKASKEAR